MFFVFARLRAKHFLRAKQHVFTDGPGVQLGITILRIARKCPMLISMEQSLCFFVFAGLWDGYLRFA